MSLEKKVIRIEIELNQNEFSRLYGFKTDAGIIKRFEEAILDPMYEHELSDLLPLKTEGKLIVTIHNKE